MRDPTARCAPKELETLIRVCLAGDGIGVGSVSPRFVLKLTKLK